VQDHYYELHRKDQTDSGNFTGSRDSAAAGIFTVTNRDHNSKMFYQQIADEIVIAGWIYSKTYRSRIYPD
jgi:hypothetical protein